MFFQVSVGGVIFEVPGVSSLLKKSNPTAADPLENSRLPACGQFWVSQGHSNLKIHNFFKNRFINIQNTHPVKNGEFTSNKSLNYQIFCVKKTSNASNILHAFPALFLKQKNEPPVHHLPGIHNKNSEPDSMSLILMSGQMFC